MPHELAELTAVFAPVRHEKSPPSRLGRPGRAWGSLRNELAFRRHIEGLVREAVALGRKHRTQAVWAILDAPTSIALARPVAQALGTPLIGLVWDDAEHLAASLGLGRVASVNMIRRMGLALRAAQRCAVIGATMKQQYEARYGTYCVVLRHGLARQLLRPVRRCDNGSNVFSLGFAGTMNAPCTFNALLAALDSTDWRIAGRDIELRLVGPRFDMRSNKPALFRSFGWRSVAQTIDILAESDATYLPQPFAQDRRNMATLSFPTKLTTYLAAGRPIVLHAPDYASLPQYHHQQPLGLHCGSTDPQTIVAALRRLITEPSFYAQAADDARKAYEVDFTQERFRGSFAELLAVPISELTGQKTH